MTGYVYSYSSTPTIEYVYDEYNQLTTVKDHSKNEQYSYTYDKDGNITSLKRYSMNSNGWFPVSTLESYSYTYADSDGWGDLLTSYNGETITYDAIGNPLTYRDGMTMTWVNGRELSSLSKDGKTYNFTYDPSGLRTKKSITTSSGSTTNVEYIYEGGQLMQMTYDGYVFDFSYDANGSPIGFKYTIPGASVSSYYYYGLNSRGDVEALYTSTGSISAIYEYDAYGKLLSVKNSSGAEITGEYSIAHLNPLRYRGYVYDNETGLYYLQSRYYDPTTCRFINADVLINVDYNLNGANMFCYCNNNPIAFADSQGFFAVAVIPDVSPYIPYDAYTKLTSFFIKSSISAAANVFLTKIKEYPITNELFNIAMWGGGISKKTQDNMIEKFFNSPELDKAIIETLAKKAKSSMLKDLHGSVEFTSEDLFYAIHWADIYLTGEYLSNGWWSLEVKVTDKFDFTELWVSTKGLSVGSLANDLGYFMQNADMLTPYRWNITFAKRYFVGE